MAIAEGLNSNDSDLTQQMMANLSDAVGRELAAGLNSNSRLVTTLMAELDGDTGREVALGLNQNAAGGKAFLETMLGATSPGFAQALSAAINTAPYNMDSFLSVLIQNLDADTARDAAQGLNSNPAFIQHLLMNLDGKGTAEQMAANEDWTIALTAALDPAALAGALNTALATPGGQAFMADLLGNLDGGIIAEALDNSQNVTGELIALAGERGLGETIASALNDSMEDLYENPSQDFLVELFKELESRVLVEIINGSLQIHSRDLPMVHDVDHDGFTGLHGHNFLECLWVHGEGFLFNLIYTQSWARIMRHNEIPLFPPSEVRHWDP